MIQFDECFSNGLKPPTSLRWILQKIPPYFQTGDTCHFEWPGHFWRSIRSISRVYLHHAGATCMASVVKDGSPFGAKIHGSETRNRIRTLFYHRSQYRDI